MSFFLIHITYYSTANIGIVANLQHIIFIPLYNINCFSHVPVLSYMMQKMAIFSQMQRSPNIPVEDVF